MRRLSELPAESATPPAAWAAARAFTERCADYARAELVRREASAKDSSEWKVYLRFCEHTLRELDDGTLDGWFDPEVPPPTVPG